MPFAGRRDIVTAGSEYDHSILRRQDGVVGYLPHGQVVRIVRQVPPIEIDVLNVVVLQFDPVRAIIVVIQQDPVIGGQEFADHHIRQHLPVLQVLDEKRTSGTAQFLSARSRLAPKSRYVHSAWAPVALQAMVSACQRAKPHRLQSL